MKIVCLSEAAMLDIFESDVVPLSMRCSTKSGGVHFIRSLTAVMLSWTHQMHQSPRFQLTFVALETMVDEVGLCTLLHWTMLRILRPRIKYMGVATQ